MVFWRTFEHGVAPVWESLTTPEAKHAFWLTLTITAIAVPANTIFGVACAIAIVRHRFRGAGLVNAIVDLPLALSPVVVGLALLLLYGRDGWVDLPFQVVFALPGMVLATVFVSLPFVVREVVPILREFGAVSVVSGRVVGQTETLTIHVEQAFQNFDVAGAYAASTLLAAIAVATLVLMSLFKPKEH